MSENTCPLCQGTGLHARLENATCPRCLGTKVRTPALDSLWALHGGDERPGAIVPTKAQAEVINAAGAYAIGADRGVLVGIAALALAAVERMDHEAGK